MIYVFHSVCFDLCFSSILLCLDGLAWLNADSATGRRRSCLPLHMRVLMNLFQLLHVIDAPEK